MGSCFYHDNYYLRRRRRLCFRCGLFVCLSVCCPSDYSQTCERILTNFLEGYGMAQGPSDTILVVIRITLRIRESKVRNLDHPDWRRFVLSECILVIIMTQTNASNPLYFVYKRWQKQRRGQGQVEVRVMMGKGERTE